MKVQLLSFILLWSALCHGATRADALSSLEARLEKQLHAVWEELATSRKEVGLLKQQLSIARKEIKDIQRGTSAGHVTSNTTVYAFSVRLHEDTVTGDSPVIFGTIDLNIDGVYDEFTGVFTPPVSGIYLLSLYAAVIEESNGPIYIKSNDRIPCEMSVGGIEDDENMSCTAIAELTAGDTVRVTGDSSNTITVAAPDSGFSGHLIQAYP